MAPEIRGEAREILGHLAGSRRYGSATRSSDWDFSFEDNEWTQSFLKSAGFKLINKFAPGERGNSASYWKHRYYNCEVFLTRINEVKQQATWWMRWFQWCDIMHDKTYRVRLWTALELCLTTVWAIRKEYLAAVKQQNEDGYRLREHPITDRRTIL